MGQDKKVDEFGLSWDETKAPEAPKEGIVAKGWRILTHPITESLGVDKKLESTVAPGKGPDKATILKAHGLKDDATGNHYLAMHPELLTPSSNPIRNFIVGAVNAQTPLDVLSELGLPGIAAGAEGGGALLKTARAINELAPRAVQGAAASAGMLQAGKGTVSAANDISDPTKTKVDVAKDALEAGLGALGAHGGIRGFRVANKTANALNEVTGATKNAGKAVLDEQLAKLKDLMMSHGFDPNHEETLAQAFPELAAEIKKNPAGPNYAQRIWGENGKPEPLPFIEEQKVAAKNKIALEKAHVAASKADNNAAAEDIKINEEAAKGANAPVGERSNPGEVALARAQEKLNKLHGQAITEDEKRTAQAIEQANAEHQQGVIDKRLQDATDIAEGPVVERFKGVGPDNGAASTTNTYSVPDTEDGGVLIDAPEMGGTRVGPAAGETIAIPDEITDKMRELHGKLFTTKADAEAFRKDNPGSEVYKYGSRGKYRLQFPAITAEENALREEAQKAAEASAFSDKPVPNEGAPRGGGNTYVADLPYDPNKVVDELRGGLTPEEFQRLKSISTGKYTNATNLSPELQAERAALEAKQRVPQAEVSDYTGGQPQETIEVAPPEGDNGYPASWDDVPPEEPPPAPVKPKGPKPKGPAPSKAEAFKAKAAAIADQQPVVEPPVDAGLVNTRLAASDNGANALDQLFRDAHGDNVPTDLNPQGHGTMPQVNPVGEVEPTLPGIEPQVNTTPPVAEVPFALEKPVASAPQPTQGPDLFDQIVNGNPEPQAFDWPEAGAHFKPNSEGSHVAVPKPPPAIPARLFKSRLEATGENYGAIKAAKKAGEVVPEEGRRLAAQGAQAETNNFADQIASGERPVTDIDSLPEQSRKLMWDRVKRSLNKPTDNQAGFATAGLMGRLAGAGLGATAGYKEDPIGSPELSAGIGGGLGFFAPEIAEGVINHAPGLESILAKSRDKAIEGANYVNQVHNMGLLSPLSVAKKALGDAGGLTIASIKNPSKAGDIISQFLTPEGRAGISNSFKEGWNGSNQEALGGLSVAKALNSNINPYSWSGKTMGGLTKATKDILGNAGFTGPEQRYYTLTDDPRYKFTRKLYEMSNSNKVIKNVIPFARVAINRIERGIEHSPVGPFLPEAKVPTPAGDKIINAALGTGAAMGVYSATPDDFVKNHPVYSGLISASGGPVGLPIMAAMALKNSHIRKNDPFLSRPSGSKLVDAGKEIGRDVPGLQLIQDLDKPEGFWRNYLAGYTNATRPIALLQDYFNGVSQEPDLNSKELSDFDRLTNRMKSNVPFWRQTLPRKESK